MTTKYQFILSLLSAMLAPAWVLAAQDIDERRPLANDGSVTIINVAGDITITAWDRAEVQLLGSLGDESTLDISESGQGLRIEVKQRDEERNNQHYESSELQLTVPEGATVSASGVSSDIEIRGLRGAAVTAETVSGDVKVTAHSNRVDLKSVSGDIGFDGASPRVTAESVSGDVVLRGVEGELNVSVVSGDVELQAGALDRGRFEAVSGSLDLALSLRENSSVNVESMSGDVNVVLPAGQAMEIRAQTFSGSIRSGFGSPQKVSHGPGSRLDHTEAGGGASLRLESFSGDVEISQQ